MKTVPLHGGKAAGRVALVDDEDYDLVMQYRWHVTEHLGIPGVTRPNVYATTGIWLGNHTSSAGMHKLITGYPMTDHRNHDGLDNQRHNLRPATLVQNVANKRPQLGSASGYKGVWHNVGKKKPWAARICVDGHRTSLGCFTTPEEAARAYDVAARAAWGEYAYLNFP